MRTTASGAAALLVAALAAAGAACAGEAGHHHRFRDAERWARVFDDPRRDAWQKPQEVIAALAPRPDAVVADIGAGTGYFAARLARELPQGRVYAVDVEPDMVEHLRRRAQEAKLANLHAVQATPADPRLPEKVDLALLVGVYHHVGNRPAYFARLREALKPGARLAIIDFRLDSPVGPPRQGRLAPETVKRELGEAGDTLAGEHDFLPYQYFLVFRPDRSG